MELEFHGEIYQWRGPAPYYFIAVPEKETLDLKAAAAALSYGWGMLPIQARIGGTEWKTSLWTKDGHYLLPLKDVVRDAEDLSDGDAITVHLSLTATAKRTPPKKQAPQPRAPRPTGPRTPVTDEQLAIVPANLAAWEDLQAIFGGGDPARCSCQRFRMLPRESWASVGPEGLAARLREQTNCDDREAPATTGLVAYLDGEPVGWCAVAPRSGQPRLLRDVRIPWWGRTEDKADATVWAVTCFITRAGYRRRGISRALARAAVDFARERGARAIEGYPDLVDGGSVGSQSVFSGAGFTEVSRPTIRRTVMRIDF